MEVMTSQELLRQHMTDSAIEKTLRSSDRKKKKKNKDDDYENCPQCDKQIKSSGLTVHMRTHIVDEDFHCDRCDAQFKTQKYLSRHVAVVHTKKGFHLQCSYCEKTFKFKDKLRQHEMIHTGEKPHKCDVCGKAFRAIYSLNTHMLIHTDEKPYACAFCEYKCRDSSTIRKHQERHLGSAERFHCKLCTKSYQSKASLKVHIAQDHLNLLETKVECHICKKKYRNNQTLASHIKRFHERATQTNCDVCDKTVDKGNLLAHMRTHCHIRAYKCDYPVCGKRFKNKGDMKKHSVIHYPSQQKTCKDCGRVFTKPHRYERHLRQGHQPKKKTERCSVCKVMFYTRNHLLKHMHMKHSKNKKQYNCAHCKFTTAIKPSLIGHLKSHEHDFDRECKICHTKYKRYEYLKSHYLKTHKIKYKPERFPKVKRKLLRPKMLDSSELETYKQECENRASCQINVEVKIEPTDDDAYEDMPLSDLKNQKESEVEITGTAKPIPMKDAQTVLAKRISRRAKDFKRVDGFEDFVDKRIVDKNMDFRTKTTQPGKTINYLKIASEKDINRLLRNARKRKQIESEEAERNLLDRMKRIYNERLLDAARKRETTETKQFKKILKVKLQRDPVLDSYFFSNNNDINNSMENDSENDSQNNTNKSDTGGLENYITAVENDNLAFENDTPTLENDIAVTHDIATIQSSFADKDASKESTSESSVLDNDSNVVSIDTSTVQYTTKTNILDKNILKTTENKTKNGIPDPNGIKIVKTVSLSLPKDNSMQETSENIGDSDNFATNTDLTIFCNGINTGTNTSYWDISNKNEHRIVQEKSVLEINVELTECKVGDTVVNILGHSQEEINETSNFNNSDVKPNISNLKLNKNTTDSNEMVKNDINFTIDQNDMQFSSNSNKNRLEINKQSIEKHRNASLNDAFVFESESELFIKEEEYSENDVITFDNNDLEDSLKDLEKSILKSENDMPSSVAGGQNQINDDLNISSNKVNTKNDNLLKHNIDVQIDGVIDNIITESDKQRLQVADHLSENDSPFIDFYMPVSEIESAKSQMNNLAILSNNTNTHSDLRTQIVDVENNIQGLESINHDLVNKRPNYERCDLENKSHDLEIDTLKINANDSKNENYDSENESRDSESENHDSVNSNENRDLENEDIDKPTTSKPKPTEDPSKYKKLNSKKITFNTSQCYVCFKLFQTKEELIHHCKQHFGICSENRLKKCPLCNFVGREYLRKHLLTNHNIDIDQGKYNAIETNADGTYTMKVTQKPTQSDINVKNIEIIPSIKQLNKQAYQKIDEKNRLKKKSNIVKRKLVKKGKEWIIETENVKLNYLDYLLPIGKDSNSKIDETIEFDYLEQLTRLSNNAKKEDRTILYPCDRCELICTNMAALKAHRKSHDKIKTGKRKPRPAKSKEIPRKKKKVFENSDPKLLEFFESNVNGVDFDDFEQFMQIYKVIDGLSDDKLALAASNKEYGLFDLPIDKTVNLVENTKTNNKIRKKCNLNKNSGYKKVVKVSEKLKEKRKDMQSKLRDKIKRNNN